MAFIAEFQDPNFFKDVVPSTGARDFLKPGYYKVVVTKAEVIANKDKDINTHATLVVTLEGLEGDAKGVSINARYNLRNPNKQAVDIGKSEMLGLFNAIGSTPINSPTEIYGKPIWIRVKDGSPNLQGRIYSEVNAAYPLTFTPPYVGIEPNYVPPVQPISNQAPVGGFAPPQPVAAYGATAQNTYNNADIPF
jgi:hypothetical protein